MNLLLAAVAAANCYNLPPDQLAYCRALEHHEVAHCYSIQDSALRTECRALLHQEPSVCNGITDPTERHLCRSKTENKAQ
ncbi:hypothetical protein [Methylobacter psychrophilus]|jgi:hypothetical protein|uniref:hypothetical protein n=1 Tax=Methylobacter psychrophilus TaxID=96941 RepID=UPI0021D499C7|nr:hypothetical protein [Methylobacter psychrophilus]